MSAGYEVSRRFLENATRRSEPMIDAVAKALYYFEERTKYRGFQTRVLIEFADPVA